MRREASLEDVVICFVFVGGGKPNSGATSPGSLLGISKRYADEEQIFTTFIGLGIDFGVTVPGPIPILMLIFSL